MHEPSDERGACPYLYPVTADRLWLYPVSAFCHRPGGPVRVPGARTVALVCSTPEHRVCLEEAARRAAT